MEEEKKKLEDFSKEYRRKLTDEIEERVHKNIQANKDKKIC